MSELEIGLTSDATYDKILLKGSGVLNLAAVFADTDFDVINHGLGYKPNVRVWFEPNNDGDVWVPHKQSILTNALLSFRVTNTDLIITAENGGVSAKTVPYYYRIYVDGTTQDDLALTSDRDTEKILLKDTGSTDVTALTTTTVMIPHTLGQGEFTKMIFSDNNIDWHEEGTVSWDAGYANYTTAICHMDSTHLYLELENGYSASSKTFYYKYVAIRRN